MFSARPLRRTIERRVANPLSKRILAGDFAEGDTALVRYVDGPDGRGEYVFDKKTKAKKREKAGARAG